MSASASRAQSRARRTAPTRTAQPLGPLPAALLAPAKRRALLEWILKRDRAAICRRVAALLRARSWLLDAGAVSLRVFGRLAATLDAATAYAAAAERAIDAVVEECARDSREGRDIDLAPPGETSLLGSATVARAACAAFNRLPTEERAALFRIAVLGESLSEAARALRIGGTVAAMRARFALISISEETDGLRTEPLS